MAYEALLQTDGVSFISTADYRNSTQSGTTRMGPNGSAQFLAMKASTSNAGVAYASTVAGSPIYGVLQNKPAVGEAMAIAVFGISKVVAGSTAITAGGLLEADTSGCLIPYSSAAGINAVGRQVGNLLPTAVGEVFQAAIFGFGQGGGSVA